MFFSFLLSSVQEGEQNLAAHSFERAEVRGVCSVPLLGKHMFECSVAAIISGQIHVRETSLSAVPSSLKN